MSDLLLFFFLLCVFVIFFRFCCHRHCGSSTFPIGLVDTHRLGGRWSPSFRRCSGCSRGCSGCGRWRVFTCGTVGCVGSLVPETPEMSTRARRPADGRGFPTMPEMLREMPAILRLPFLAVRSPPRLVIVDSKRVSDDSGPQRCSRCSRCS